MTSGGLSMSVAQDGGLISRLDAGAGKTRLGVRLNGLECSGTRRPVH